MKKKLLVNLFLLISVSVFAGRKAEKTYPFQESKSETKSFAVNANTSVEIINKYGDVIVNTWEKDSVRFEVTITAEAQKLSQVKTLLEMAEVKFTANNSLVVASLAWGGNVNAFKKSAVEMTLATGASQMLRINYTVYMPAKNTVKIENRFGNILLPDMQGKVYINLNHGDLKAQRIAHLKNASVKYGDVDVTEIKIGELDVSFGDVLIEKAETLFIKTGSGSVEIDEVEELDIEAKNSKLRIEKAGEVKGSLFFTDVRVKQLRKKLQLNSNLSDIDIRSIDKDFISVTLDCNAGDISLSFNAASSFGFDLNLEKSKTFTSDEAFIFDDDDKFDNYRKIEGKFNAGANNKLTLMAKSCNVSLGVTD